MQMKCFIINFTVSEFLGIPFCPWKNALQSQPETLMWKHMQMFKIKFAPLGKPSLHHKEASVIYGLWDMTVLKEIGRCLEGASQGNTSLLSVVL